MSDSHGERLTAQVRGLLCHVLGEADFPGSDELLRQAPNVNVVGGPVTMLDLRVTGLTTASAFTDGPIPLSIMVLDSAGIAFGELLIWVNDGYLSSLEFAWWSDDPPNELPTPDRVQVSGK
ncbi:MAG TPA: hypothetical protein VN871_05595 [Mycobacterium sp.]|nr:hypothetical protein [Mycobacterium sp.]